MPVKNEEKEEVSFEEATRKRLDVITDTLIGKLERAIDELDDFVSRVSVKEKCIEYDEEGKKAVFERVTEREELLIEKGPIDRAALKQLVGTLKELRDKAPEETESESIEIVMSDEAKDFSV